LFLRLRFIPATLNTVVRNLEDAGRVKATGTLGLSIGHYQMQSTVKCQVCGKLYNSRYISTHVRLSHPEIARAADPAAFEQKIVEQIVNLFNQLSPETRKQVRRAID
jgi:hypothetical protein